MPKKGFERVWVTVDAFILAEGEVLLEKRHSGDWGGYWALPGGHLEVGEKAADGIKREVLEETGYRVAPTGLVGIYSGRRYPGARALTLCFFARIAGGKSRPQPEEVDELRFFNPEKLPRKLAFDHRKMVSDALAILKGMKKPPVLG